VQYDPATKRIVCPCHDGVFDLEGVNISGPPPTPLTRLDVKVKSSQTITVAIRE